MSGSNSYYIDILNEITLSIYRYIFPIIYIISIIGNILSFIILLKRTWRKNVCVLYFKYYLLLSFIYLNVGVLPSVFFRGLNINLQNSNLFLCKLIFYIPFVIALLTPTILILASIDRLLISSQNVDTRLYSSKRLAYFSISISTIFWLIYHIHILLKVNIQDYGYSIYICNYDFSISYHKFLNYSIAIINPMFCLTMIILTILSFKNIRHIKIYPRQQRHQPRSMTRKDFQLLRCLFIHDIIFIISSSLLNTYYIYNAIIGDMIRSQLEETIINFSNDIFTLLYIFIYSDSFYIFMIISKTFRHELKRLIYKIIRRELLVLRGEEEDNQQQINQGNNIELNVVSNNIVVE